MARRRKLSSLSDHCELICGAPSASSVTSPPPTKRARSDPWTGKSHTTASLCPQPSSQSHGSCLQPHLWAPTAQTATSTLFPPAGSDPEQQKVNPTTADALTAFTLARPSSRTSTPRSPPPSYQSSVPLYPQADLVTPAVRSRPVPLTAKNLQKLNEKDMTHPVTPALSTKSKSTGPGPLNSQKSTNLQAVRLVMQANRIPIEDEEAMENHPHLLDHAKEIIDRTRNSPMSLEWQQNIKKKRNEYATRNESTWINKFWPALINTEGERNVQCKDKTGSPLDRDLWEAVAWEKSFLDENWDCNLRIDSVPKLETDDPNVQLMLDSLPRITNPRPDIVFGLKRQAFSAEERLVNDRYQMYAQVSQGIYHPWLLVETKTTSGNIEDVENQCCRGGASLVAAARQMIGDSDPDAASSNRGADFQAIAFSVALVPTVANIFCHWAEVISANEVVYHMHMIKSFAIRELDTAIALHHAIDNILEWGVDERKIYMKGVLRKIAEREAGMGGKKRKKDGEGDE